MAKYGNGEWRRVAELKIRMRNKEAIFFLLIPQRETLALSKKAVMHRAAITTGLLLITQRETLALSKKAVMHRAAVTTGL